MTNNIKVTAEHFGMKELDSQYFDPKVMTIKGCKCRSCWDWKTKSKYRNFWVLRELP